MADDQDDVTQLSPRQERFVEEFLIDLNATRAAREAGYSKKSAASIGQRLSQNVNVRREIERRIRERSERVKVDQDYALLRLMWLANSNIGNIATWKDGALTVKDSEELTIGQKYSIDSIQMIPTKRGPILKLKMRKPDSAIEMLCRHLGLFNGEGGSPEDALREIIKVLDAAERAKEEAGSGGHPSPELQAEEQASEPGTLASHGDSGSRDV